MRIEIDICFFFFSFFLPNIATDEERQSSLPLTGWDSIIETQKKKRKRKSKATLHEHQRIMHAPKTMTDRRLSADDSPDVQKQRQARLLAKVRRRLLCKTPDPSYY